MSAFNVTVFYKDRSSTPVAVKVFEFSGGEVQPRVNCLEPDPDIAGFKITAHLRSSTDLMTLLMLTDALRRIAAVPVKLVMPYIPYARQDRVCAPGEALAIKVFAKLINDQRYASVEVWDAHSDVALALLNRVKHIQQFEFVKELRRMLPALIAGAKVAKPGRAHRPPILVAPDAGAMKKVHESSKATGWDVVRADKTRDPKTGEITGTKVYTDAETVDQRDFLIVDDICDGGRTFIELANELRKYTSGKVYLYVTHGIFSKGLEPLLGAGPKATTPSAREGFIERIYTANSWLPDQLGLTVI